MSSQGSKDFKGVNERETYGSRGRLGVWRKGRENEISRFKGQWRGTVGLATEKLFNGMGWCQDLELSKKRNVKRTVSREQETPRERSPRERHAKRKIWSRDRLKKNGAIRAERRCHQSRTSREGGVQEKSGSGGREIKEKCPNKRNAKRKRRRRKKMQTNWSGPPFWVVSMRSYVCVFPSFPQFRNFQRPDCPGCPGSTFIMLCWCTYASRTCMWRHDWAPMRFS